MHSLEAIYKDISPKIYAFFYVKTYNKETAEDLTQEVFYSAIKSYSSFKGNSSLETWIFSIAKNILKKHFRKHSSSKTLSIDDLTQSLHTDTNMENSLIENEERLILLNLIETLDTLTKEIVILRVYSELSFKDIGVLVDKSENYARVTFHRAKIKLQKELEGYN